MSDLNVDILAIGAHPDDVELGCSGTIAKEIAHFIHINNKLRFKILCTFTFKSSHERSDVTLLQELHHGLVEYGLGGRLARFLRLLREKRPCPTAPSNVQSPRIC